jgi:ABC-type nitrate/sulfonate/bicarbonate transport system permease component
VANSNAFTLAPKAVFRRPPAWEALIQATRNFNGVFNRGNAAGIGTVVGALLLWEGVARIMHSVYVPPVTTIFATFVHEWFSPTFILQAIPSLYRMIVGYALASVVGITIGILIGSFTSLFRLLDPTLQFLRAIPPTAIIPVGILLIGLGDAMKIDVIAFGAMWPILISTTDGARRVPHEQLETARIFCLTRFETVMFVIIPSATPMIAAGMRSGLSIAFIMILISEMMGSTDGLGYYILHAEQLFAVPEMYAGIALLAILGFLLNAIFVFVEHRVLAWHYGQSDRTT